MRPDQIENFSEEWTELLEKYEISTGLSTVLMEGEGKGIFVARVGEGDAKSINHLYYCMFKNLFQLGHQFMSLAPRASAGLMHGHIDDALHDIMNEMEQMRVQQMVHHLAAQKAPVN